MIQILKLIASITTKDEKLENKTFFIARKKKNF